MLTAHGIEEFRRYLQVLRSAPESAPPIHLLYDASTSVETSFGATIESMPHGRPFTSRYEFGVYLDQTLSSADPSLISREHRLWTWLALFYFDQLCPMRKNGQRVPKSEGLYILDEKFDYSTYYRHLVRTPWIAVRMHPDESRVVLTPLKEVDAPLAVRGELIEQIASRQALFRSRTVMTAAYRLYYNPESARPRKGAGGSGPGSPRRFAAVLNQLDLTYDLESITPDAVIARLPAEFKQWKANLA